MSIPYDTITCSHCDYEATSLLSAGYFFWTNGDIKASMKRDLVVCQGCRSVSLAETLPIWEELLDAERLWRLSASERRLLRSLLGGGRNLLYYPQIALDEPHSFGLLHQLSMLHRKPVCLRCGSGGFTTLLYPSDYRDNGQIFPLRLNHPGCGGELLIHGSDGARMGIDLDERGYDWRTGRQVSGPPLGDGTGFVSGYAPPLR